MSGVNDSRWYQNPVLVLVLAIPLLAVVMGSVTLYLAFSGADTLVKDNYYREGLAINQEFDTEKQAAALQIHAMLTVSQSEVAATLQSDAPHPAELQLALLHPLLPEHDRELVLARQADGSYRAILPEVPVGSYHIRLGNDEQGWLLRAFQPITPGATLALP